jgi:transposase
MKKNSIARQSSKEGAKGAKSCQGWITVGMDLGDKTSRYCGLDDKGQVLFERATATTQKGMTQAFGGQARWRIALEVGTHSPWISRLLKSLGHEVIVANARQVKLITQSSRKNDKLDAQTLARLARIDPALLHPIQHRSEQAQLDLMQVRVRAGLVEARTSLVNMARGLAKAVGERLPKCDTDQLDVERMQALPAALQAVLKPLLEEVESLTERIHDCDKQIEQIARTKYPETALLKQVSGVGTLIALGCKQGAAAPL